MTKKEVNTSNELTKPDDGLMGATKSIKQPPEHAAEHKRRPKRPRKVKFADPLTEQRLYDRAASPSAETETKVLVTESRLSQLEQLEPPLSLVAQLDLAAKKLNARSTASRSATTATTTNVPQAIAHTSTKATTTVNDDNEQSLKSIRATKSVKSIMTKPSPKDEAKKEKKGHPG